MMFMDPTYFLIVIGALLSLWASSNVNRTMLRYRKSYTVSGLTASQAAKAILKAYGIYDVTVRQISGAASDYYSPSEKELCLLDSNYNASDVTAIGVAAHECGHAIQDAEGYMPLRLQMTIAPVCAFGSNFGFPILIAGLFFSLEPLIKAGIILFSLSVVLSILLLPVEFNASSRALGVLEEMGLMSREELDGASHVLRAAGMTYVAAAAASVLSLIRLILISGIGRRRD